MAKSTTLKQLFVTKIQALYDIESELVKALPTMAEAATDPDLKEAFEDHLSETELQAKRLEDIFGMLDEDEDTIEVEGIRGMAKDAEWCVKNVEEGDALDLALGASARTVEHYEIGEYTGAIELAEALGENDAAELLRETLEEEKVAEEKLGELSATVTGRLTEEDDMEDA